MRLRTLRLPDHHTTNLRPVLKRMMLDVSIARSLYLSIKWKGYFLVSRGTKVRIHRTAKVRLGPQALFCIGFANFNATPATIRLGVGAEVSVSGTAQILRGCRVYVHDGGHLSMGTKSYINDCSTVTCFEGIAIGSGCSISWNTNIMDTHVHEISIDGVPRPRSAPVRIEDGVWVGAGATILAGVTVGAGAVVGAASVVTSDVPPASLVAGNPARVLYRDVTWRQ